MSNPTEEKAVKDLIQRYIDGTYRADVEMLKGVFHEKAVMNGYLGPNLLIGDPSPFIEDMAGSPSMESNNDPYETDLRIYAIEGDVATVALYVTSFRGGGAIVDFFHCIKTEGEWKIISKLFTTM
jgi:hypothetical protein